MFKEFKKDNLHVAGLGSRVGIFFLIALFFLGFCNYSIAQPTNLSSSKGFKIKGFHLDLRIQVMKLEALKAFAFKLSKSGINTLIMEYEGTFPFEKHPLIANRYAYTKKEISEFVSYCANLNIDVIPLQQSFGHVEYILRNSRYTKLREDQKDFSQINPLQEKLAKELFTDLFQEMAELHHSKYIHIGCDETRLLGKSPKSKAKVEKEGIGKLYGDYVKIMCDIVLKMGKIPVLWADIALKYPESLSLLPKSAVFVDWNYGWELNKFGNHHKLMKSGFEIWGAPSLRSNPDNYNLTTWQKHFDNIQDFVPKAKDLGYTGIVMTSWSTSGVYSYLYESGTDIIDLHALRRVYPLTGFNLLLNAYLESINSSKPLNIMAFIENYGKENYGFTSSQSIDFWKALSAAPYQVSNGIVRGASISITNLLDSAQNSVDIINSLKPDKNKKEYEHYKIMAETRLLYLHYQDVESKLNQPDYSSNQLTALMADLKNIIKATKGVNDKFLNLNRNSYYTSELKVDNDLRINKMQLLYDRLVRTR